MGYVFVIVLLTLLALIEVIKCAKPFHLLILHSNNINFHFTEDHDHVGGAGRALHLLNMFREEAKSGNGPPVLYLNAGDNFAYSSSYSSDQWEMVAEYLNALGPDAMCLGNHDLDVGLPNLTRFLQNLAVPVVGANINFNSENTLSRYVRNSIVLDVGGHKIGIIGVTTSTSVIPHLPKGLSLEDEVECVRRESSVLHEMGIDIIVVLSHSGYDVDKLIARAVDHVDLIVAGHRQSDIQKPVTIRRDNGEFVPILREEGDLRHLGMFNVFFDEQGNVIKMNGQPILLHRKIPQMKSMLELHNRFKRDEDEIKVGITRTPLTNNCHAGECNYANLITDAMVSHVAGEHIQDDDRGYWTSHPIAIINSGMIERKVNKGKINRSDLKNSMKYTDKLTLIEIQGEHLKTALEQGLQTYNTRNAGFLQFSGLHVQYNLTKSFRKRINRLYARCGDCKVPSFEEVKDKVKYKIVINRHISHSKNKDKITAFGRHATQKAIDVDLGTVLEKYLAVFEFVTPEHSERIQLSKAVKSTTPESLLFVTLIISYLFLY